MSVKFQVRFFGFRRSVWPPNLVQFCGFGNPSGPPSCMDVCNIFVLLTKILRQNILSMLILNGLKSNKFVAYKLNEFDKLHVRSECNLFERVQFFPNCSKPFNMYIIKWEPYLAKFGDILIPQIVYPFNYYIILNGFFNNSGINWTSSTELHERSECNSIDRVQFIPELLKKPFNMYIIKWDSPITIHFFHKNQMISLELHHS